MRDEFPITLAIMLGVLGLFMVGMLGYGVGKIDLRNEYARCIMIGAPQENCLKQMLGEK